MTANYEQTRKFRLNARSEELFKVALRAKTWIEMYGPTDKPDYTDICMEICRLREEIGPPIRQLDWGTVPDDLEISEPFVIQVNQYDRPLIAVINQAVGTVDRGVGRYGGCIIINDSASMRRILRRLIEIDDKTEKSATGDLAGDIMATLGYEWV